MEMKIFMSLKIKKLNVTDVNVMNSNLMLVLCEYHMDVYVTV